MEVITHIQVHKFRFWSNSVSILLLINLVIFILPMYIKNGIRLGDFSTVNKNYQISITITLYYILADTVYFLIIVVVFY